MKRLNAYLAVTAAALAVTAFQPGAATAGSDEIQIAKLERIDPHRTTLKRVDPSKLQLSLLCSPKYQPSPGAASVSRKGGSYTCLHQMPIPPGTKCRNGFSPTAVEAKVMPGGKYVRLIYRCQSAPW